MARLSTLLAGSWLVIGMPAAVSAAPCAGFTDVEDTSGFCTSIAWMKNRAITLGCTATQYCPSDFVRRDQMAAFMYRLGFQNAFLKGGNAFGGPAQVGTTDNQPVDVLANNGRVARFEYADPSPNVLLGHWSAGTYGGVYGATIAGGGSTRNDTMCTTGFGCVNGVTDHFGTVGGGESNKAGDLDGDVSNSTHATVGGGFNNFAGRFAATIGGGTGNIASNLHSTVAGGLSNTATGNSSTVAGGYSNTASGEFSTVAGGYNNTASGAQSTVAGGFNNTASATGSFAAGSLAKARFNGCMVFGDDSAANAVSCGAANQFMVRAVGGTYLFTGGSSDATYTGVYVGPGSGSWSVYSDRDGKESLNAVDPVEIAHRLAAIPLSTWQWKAEPNQVRHMGPMAQDFHAAFGLGASERHISTVDADGVALAAIQGVYKLVQQKDAEISALKREITDLRTAQHTELAGLRAAQQKELADLRLAVEVLMARTSPEGRVAQGR